MDCANSSLLSALGAMPFLRHGTGVRVGTVPIHCEVFEHDPGAPVLIFVPGIGTYAALYAPLLSRLARSGYNVVGVDLRGHGHSGGPRGDYTVEQVVDDLDEVITHFADRWAGPVGIMGYSIGAPLALAAAEHDERIAAVLCHTLVLSEHPPDLVHLWGWQWLRHAGFFFPYMRVPIGRLIDMDELIPSRRFQTLVDDDPLLVRHYTLETLASVFNRESRVATKMCRFQAAIVAGEQDAIVPLDYLKRIVARMRHPFELIPVAGANHLLPFQDPAGLAAVAAEWFDRALGEIPAPSLALSG